MGNVQPDSTWVGDMPLRRSANPEGRCCEDKAPIQQQSVTTKKSTHKSVRDYYSERCQNKMILKILSNPSRSMKRKDGPRSKSSLWNLWKQGGWFCTAKWIHSLQCWLSVVGIAIVCCFFLYRWGTKNYILYRLQGLEITRNDRRLSYSWKQSCRWQKRRHEGKEMTYIRWGMCALAEQQHSAADKQGKEIQRTCVWFLKTEKIGSVHEFSRHDNVRGRCITISGSYPGCFILENWN